MLALPGRMAWRCCLRNALRADAWFVPELRWGGGRSREAETWASADLLLQAAARRVLVCKSRHVVAGGREQDAATHNSSLAMIE